MGPIRKIAELLDAAGEISDSNNDIPITGRLEAHLRYANYVNQRFMYPEVSPERWVAVYGPEAIEYEKRFVQEVANA